MGDLDGDGTMDVVESNHVLPPSLVAGTPVQHYYYLIGSSDPTVMNTNNIPMNKLFSSSSSGRSVDVGQLFGASTGPDIVHGLEDGVVRLFANRGLDENTTEFLGFKTKGKLQVQPSCSIRDIKIASLSPCTVSLVCAVTCGTGNSGGKNHIFTKRSKITCTQDEDVLGRRV